MYRLILIGVALALVVGCAKAQPAPTLPSEPQVALDSGQGMKGPHHIWGEWTFYFNAAHDWVQVVPKRQARLHLNALKFLESYCTDCLKITNIKKNGDSTIDLTVQITHPFIAHPEYTGFDVKGIIMFQGSREYVTEHPYFLFTLRPIGRPGG